MKIKSHSVGYSIFRFVFTYYFLVFGSANILYSQITFQKTFGGLNFENGLNSLQTSDGGFIVVGATKSYGAGNNDIYLIKTNATEDTVWTKTFGGAGNDEGRYVQQTTDGGYIIVGFTDGFGLGNIDIYVIKTDALGNLLWSKTFGGTGYDYGASIKQTTDDGFIITGWEYSFGAGGTDGFLIKTNNNGDILWSKTYGGTSYEVISSVQQTNDGGFILTGSTRSFGAGNDDVYLVKTDSIGNTMWSKAFGGDNIDQGYSVSQTPDGGYILVGITYSFGEGNVDAYLIRTDANGDHLWSKTYGGIDEDDCYSLIQNANNDLIFAGITNSFGVGNYDAYIIKCDLNGDTLWTKTYGGINDDRALSIQETGDGGYIIGGITNSFGAGDNDVFLIKCDLKGNSGCNAENTATIVNTASTQVASPTTLVSSGILFTSPQTVVGSGGNVNTLCSFVSINELNICNSFYVFPNPTVENFTIVFEKIISKGQIQILNTNGLIVLEENIYYESKKEIKLKNISSGFYIISINDGEKSYNLKIIVN